MTSTATSTLLRTFSGATVSRTLIKVSTAIHYLLVLYLLCPAVDITTIRKWLGPRDRNLQAVSSDVAAAKTVRAEFTCEWAQRHLLDFFRGKDPILAIDGAAGTGKSVLSGWVEERLQRPLGRKSYETLSYTFGKL